MQLVFASELPRLLDGSGCVIATPFYRIDEPFYAPVHCVTSRRRNLFLGSAWLFWLLLKRLFSHSCPAGFPLDSEIDAMTRCVAVVDLSGDMLTEDYGPHVGYSHFLPLLQAIAMGKPVVIIAQSVGPFRWLYPLARLVLKKAALITLREEISLQLLFRMGVNGSRVARTADLAFLLPQAKSNKVDDILRHEGAEDTRTQWLGVSVSALLLSRRRGRWGTRGGDPLDVIAQTLDRISSAHGLTPLLISHVTGPKHTADDRRVARLLQKRMRCHSLMLDADYRPEELKGVIGRCRIFMGLRMHANIAALDNAVPTLAIGYSHKTAGIMRLLGLERHVLHYSEMCDERLAEHLEYLIQHGDEIRSHLLNVLPGVREDARRNFALVADVLRQSETWERRA